VAKRREKTAKEPAEFIGRKNMSGGKKGALQAVGPAARSVCSLEGDIRGERVGGRPRIKVREHLARQGEGRHASRKREHQHGDELCEGVFERGRNRALTAH